MNKKTMKCVAIYSYDCHQREYRILVLTYRGETVCRLRATISEEDDAGQYVYKLFKEGFLSWDVVSTKKTNAWLDSVMDDMIDLYVYDEHSNPAIEYVVEKHLNV